MSVTESFLQDGEEPDKMPEWLLEEKRDFEEHLDEDGDKILNTDEIREWVAPSEGNSVKRRSHISSSTPISTRLALLLDCVLMD